MSCTFKDGTVMGDSAKSCQDFYKVDYALSCYGAPSDKQCVTCGDVVSAYNRKNWAMNPRDFVHCQNIINNGFKS